MGLTSRAGVMPLNLLADVAGPMARTVEDAVTVFQVVVGSDPADPVTAAASAHLPQNYAASLVRDGLKGARIGVLRFAYERDSTDPEIVQVFMRAVDDLQNAGATIVDPGVVDGIGDIRRQQGAGPCMGFKYDINRYLASHGDRVPVKSLTEIVKSGRFHPTVRRAARAGRSGRGEWSRVGGVQGGDDVSRAGARRRHEGDGRAEDRCVGLSDVEQPAAIDRRSRTHPAATTASSSRRPRGFRRSRCRWATREAAGLPAGITFFGRAWSEPALIKYAYAYEQATRHRRPPESTPPLR